MNLQADMMAIPEVDLQELVDYEMIKNVRNYPFLWSYWAFALIWNVMTYYSDMGVKGFKVISWIMTIRNG